MGSITLSWEAILTALGLFVALVVWLVRLESKNNQNSRDIEHMELSFKEKVKSLEDEAKEFRNAIFTTLSSIEKSLAKIEGRLSIKEDKDL